MSRAAVQIYILLVVCVMLAAKISVLFRLSRSHYRQLCLCVQHCVYKLCLAVSARAQMKRSQMWNFFALTHTHKHGPHKASPAHWLFLLAIIGIFLHSLCAQFSRPYRSAADSPIIRRGCRFYSFALMLFGRTKTAE